MDNKAAIDIRERLETSAMVRDDRAFLLAIIEKLDNIQSGAEKLQKDIYNLFSEISEKI